MTASRGGGAIAIAAESRPPAELESYRLLTKLASGGMATVYLGAKRGVAGFERLVAIKVCHPHLRDDEDFVSMFLDEARLAARIHHPNVVATLDVTCSDVLYFVMEYVEGDSFGVLLRSAAKQGALVPIEIVVRVMIDALTGLHAAHELHGSDGQPLNLVHRDVSPQNIMVGTDGISRITDFGIASASARSIVTEGRQFKGKSSYMAPERVRGEKATRLADIFSVGVVLWEALTGRPLFRSDSNLATLKAVLRNDIPEPSSVAPHVPAALDAIVMRALDRNPANRYQTAAEFADALELMSTRPATTRIVASYVEDKLGVVLAKRRLLVREASDKGLAGAERDIDTNQHRVSSPPVTTVHPRSGPGAYEVDVDLDVDVGTPVIREGLPGDVEHRRMRALIAAVMLILVGSGVGLLLARFGGG